MQFKMKERSVEDYEPQIEDIKETEEQQQQQRSVGKTLISFVDRKRGCRLVLEHIQFSLKIKHRYQQFQIDFISTK